MIALITLAFCDNDSADRLNDNFYPLTMTILDDGSIDNCSANNVSTDNVSAYNVSAYDISSYNGCTDNGSTDGLALLIIWLC